MERKREDEDKVERDGILVGIYFMQIKPTADGMSVAQKIQCDPKPPDCETDEDFEALHPLHQMAVEMEALSDWDPMWFAKMVKCAWRIMSRGAKLPDDPAIFARIIDGFATGLLTIQTVEEFKDLMEGKDDQPDEDDIDWSKN